jgi:hypothetical protein
MDHGFFHPVSGYWQTVSTPSSDIIAAYPDGTIEVPIRPSPLHKWIGKEWQAPTQAMLDAEQSMIVRETRDTILENIVDPIVSNPLRWAEMSAAKKTAWAVYRRALLDVPQQDGFPNVVVWPTAPEA